jgi:acyl-homoserine-lactone acylase
VSDPLRTISRRCARDGLKATEMTILNVVSKACYSLFILLILASCAGLRSTEKSGESPPIRNLSDNEVTLVRDDWGVPHIYADTESAGYFALGYAQAEDQGERVMFLALMAMGEAASLEGPAMLPSDIEARRWMHAEESQAAMSHLSTHIQENYRAYATGFNRFFAEHPDNAPEWRFELEAWHLVAISRNILWPYMAGDGLSDCRRGGVRLSRGQVESLERRASFASNVWVLHPERTADGAMMLLSDPHGGIEEGIFYEYRIHAGALHSAGFSLGGALLLAHTRSLTWGMTTGSPDVSDCYAVETDPENPLRYRFDGEWREMTTQEVAIEIVKGQTHRQTFAYTDHNGVLSPVVARSGPTAYVVSTPYMHAAHALDEEIDRLNRARNVNEAKHAMRDLGMFGQNLMFADAEGNSWYVRAGRAPIRSEGFDWSRPVPGNTSATRWRGFHPVQDLMQAASPTAGYMQNANDSPDNLTVGAALLDPADYPAYLFNDRLGRSNSRGRRANEVLSRAEGFTIENAIDFALDEKWVQTADWTSALADAARAEGSGIEGWDRPHRDFLDAVLSFDGHARADSDQALKYAMWRRAVHEQIEDERTLTSLDDVTDEVLLSGISRALDTVTDFIDRGIQTLGDLVRIDSGAEDYSVGGISLRDLSGSCFPGPCEVTMRAFSADPLRLPAAPVRVRSGSRILRLVVFTDPIRSYTVRNFGQSDDPSSPHFDDQARLLTSQRQMKPVYFNRHDLAGRIHSEIQLRYESVAP